MQSEMRRARHGDCVQNSLKLGTIFSDEPIEQPVLTRSANSLAGGCLDSQTLAAFGATARQNGAAVFGGHTGTETVGTSALDGAWLESTFHDSYLAVTEELKIAPV